MDRRTARESLVTMAMQRKCATDKMEQAFAAFDEEPRPRRRRLRKDESVPVPELGLPNVSLSGTAVFVDEFPDGTRIPVIQHPKALIDGLLRLLAFREHGRLQGAEFRFIRHALGLSQAELAGQLGLSRETISRYEAGRLKIGVRVAAAIRLKAVMKLISEMPPGLRRTMGAQSDEDGHGAAGRRSTSLKIGPATAIHVR